MAFDFTPFKILTFDCYGTLIDWEQGILDAGAPWFKLAGYHGDDDRLLASFAAAESIEEQRTPGKPYPGILEATYHRMCTDLGVLVTAEHGKTFGASVGTWPPFADTSEALKRLQSRFKLGILSNVDHASFAQTEAKLGVIFDLVVTAADVGTYKPNPQNFRCLLERVHEMGIAPRQVLHVAQSLHHDHAPAQKLGLTTCWIDRRAGRGGGAVLEADGVRPNVTFTTLAALADAAGV